MYAPCLHTAESLVRMEGLEPPRLSTPEPKSGAATNYATSAYLYMVVFLPTLTTISLVVFATLVRTSGFTSILTCTFMYSTSFFFTFSSHNTFSYTKKWSEMRDSNSRPSGPKPDALPDCANLRVNLLITCSGDSYADQFKF